MYKAKNCEANEQTSIFDWARWKTGNCPELELLYAIPNGGRRDKVEAAHLKRQGVKAGVPDMCLPVARGRYHGLYIELKRSDGGRVSENQRIWIMRLRKAGYCARVCRGADEAIDTIERYLEMKMEEK